MNGFLFLSILPFIVIQLFSQVPQNKFYFPTPYASDFIKREGRLWAANSPSVKQETQEDPLLDEFDEEEGMNPPILPNIKTKNSSRFLKKNSSNSSPSNHSTSRIEKSNYEEIKSIFTYGTYQEQSQVLTRLTSRCKREKNWSEINDMVRVLEENSFFKKPFQQDEALVLTMIDWIQSCHLTEKKELILQVLTDEFQYRDYRESTKNQMKAEAWGVLADFYDDLTIEERDDYAQILDKYYRYSRYHNNDLRIKQAVLSAAVKFRPPNFNKLLKREYTKEENLELKNAIIETVGSYGDIQDIEFLDRIIKEEEGPNSHRWVSVVAFTNYTPNPQALRMVKKYLEMPEKAIVVRAYYVLSFYNLGLDFFMEAAKNNDENIRLQAVQAMDKFPLLQVKEVLEYKKRKDSSNAVRQAAEKILKEKNP